MPRRHPGSPIAVSFSTRGALMPAWMTQHVAATANVHGVDVDATSPVGVWLAARFGAIERPHMPVRTIWLSCEGLRSARNRKLVERVSEQQPDGAPLVVTLISGASTLRELSRAFEVISAMGSPWNMAIGLPPSTLKGGRPHLVQLGGIRRFAEEWDLTIAVDLAGRFDPTWEAEAAVARLGNRLSLLRLPASAAARSAVGRDRVACRALHAAIDRAELLDVAIAPVKPVPFPITPRAAANDAHRAADYVAERAAFHARGLRENIGRFEGSPSSQSA
jgi:hypothetical protein